jgi:hypothetical protein
MFFKMCWACWYTPIILALRRLRQGRECSMPAVLYSKTLSQKEIIKTEENFNMFKTRTL